MNLWLLEVAMCGKCRSSHFQSEEGSKKLKNWVVGGGGGEKNFRTGGEVYRLFFFRGGGLLLGGGLYTITCHNADRRYSVTTEQETTLFTKLITITVK